MSSYYFIGQSFAGPFNGTTGTFSGALTLTGASPVINSTGATGNLLSFQKNGTTVASIDPYGQYIPTWAAMKASAWGWDDFWGVNEGTYTTGGSGFVLTGNGSGVGITAPGEHLGFYYYTASAVAESSIQNRSTFTIAKSSGRTITWYGLLQPLTLSTSTDRYTAYFGFFDNVTTPYNGAYFKYSDNLNSGQWILCCAEAGTETTTNTSTTVTAGWHNFQIVLTESNATYTFYIDGVLQGTVVAPNLNTGSLYDVGAFSVNLNRTISSGATINAWVCDLYTINVPGLTR